MNWHQVIDERSYEMDQVIADILRRSPEKLDLVCDWISRKRNDPLYSERAKDVLQEWDDLIHDEGVTGVLRVLEDRSEEGDRMRQNSPFGVLMPQDQRMSILKKYEARRTRAPLAGV